jgi:hypothetical protein
LEVGDEAEVDQIAVVLETLTQGLYK